MVEKREGDSGGGVLKTKLVTVGAEGNTQQVLEEGGVSRAEGYSDSSNKNQVVVASTADCVWFNEVEGDRGGLAGDEDKK